jgi:phage tail sheath protein FI
MPVTPTYPGVYIEEVPSGVRTITGVATSITAFIGRTLRGPVNDPVMINSFGDYERVFGGLVADSPVSYAVRDFYLNGGSQAVIVRLFRPTDADREAALATATAQAQPAATAVARAARTAATATATPDAVAVAAETTANTTGTPGSVARAAATAVAQAARTAVAGAANAAAVATAAEAAVEGAVTAAANAAVPAIKAQLVVNTLNLEAAYEGTWGNALRARIDHDVVGSADLFNLSVKDGGTGQIETMRNVSVVPTHPRRVDKVLEQESKLVRTRGVLPGTRPGPSQPTATLGVVAPGQDPFAAATSSGVTVTASDTQGLTVDEYLGSRRNKRGLYALEKTDLFNLLCIPPFAFDRDVQSNFWDTAASYCQERRAMLIVDPPISWVDKDTAKGNIPITGIAALGTRSLNAAVFFPRLRQPNPLRDNQIETFVPCGAVAGVFARTDAQRGVWKAPAGLEATLVGVPGLSVMLTDAENGELNPRGINCLRVMPAAGRLVWGARTLQGDDRLASEWKYIPVRRLALYIEESLYRGTQWVVFEPNDEPLWAQIRLNVGAFMQNLFRQGAFQGKTPREAYFVKCDKETTTQNDINLGIVNIIVGFAPLKPAEFVIIKLQQMAGQIAA